MLSRKLNHWDQALGQKIDNAFRTSIGTLVLYFDELESSLEIESINNDLYVGIQSIDSKLDDPDWLPENTLTGRIIEQIIVPYFNSTRFDGRVRLSFDTGKDLYISAELENTPLRIT